MKPNAWLIKEPNEEQAEAMFFAFYREMPWFGKKRKETYARKFDEAWVVLLTGLDISEVPLEHNICIRRISQHSNSYIIYTQERK